MLTAWAQKDDVESRMLDDGISGAIFAAGARASFLVVWFGTSARVPIFPSSLGDPSAEKSPSERTFPRTLVLSSLAALGKARDRLYTFAQPDGHTAAWGVNSSAELPAHDGPADPYAGDLMGNRIPVLSGLVSDFGYRRRIMMSP